MGEMLPLAGPVHLRVDAQAPEDARITLLRNGITVASAQGTRLEHDAPAEPAAYRVEVTLPGSTGTPPVPWMVSNPIYVGRGRETSAPQETLADPLADELGHTRSDSHGTPPR